MSLRIAFPPGVDITLTSESIDAMEESVRLTQDGKERGFFYCVSRTTETKGHKGSLVLTPARRCKGNDCAVQITKPCPDVKVKTPQGELVSKGLDYGTFHTHPEPHGFDPSVMDLLQNVHEAITDRRLPFDCISDAKGGSECQTILPSKMPSNTRVLDWIKSYMTIIDPVYQNDDASDEEVKTALEAMDGLEDEVRPLFTGVHFNDFATLRGPDTVTEPDFEMSHVEVVPLKGFPRPVQPVEPEPKPRPQPVDRPRPNGKPTGTFTRATDFDDCMSYSRGQLMGFMREVGLTGVGLQKKQLCEALLAAA